ncbi:MAG: hypothetical protein GX975_06940, partial [Clostridiales bacterium]|nr:hypothetical protein [Clostridiales bacterium]
SSAYDIPAWTQGTAIKGIDVSGGASGGTKPYTFSASGLPAGISISSAGVISGTPTAAGAAGTATITVTDSAGTSRSITISYGKIADPLSLTNSPACDIPASTVGKAIANVDVKSAAGFSGGTAPQVFSATGLPAGLKINPWTGVIYGAPTGVGPGGTVTITVTDGAGATKSITINYGAISTPASGGGGGAGGELGTRNPYERNPVGSKPVYPVGASDKEKAYIDKMFYLRQTDLRLFVNIPYTELSKATIEYHEPYIVGFEDVTFRGDSPLTRIQLATIFSKLLKKTDADVVPISYEDMDEDSKHWGTLFLRRIESTGMFSGYPDGEFKPNKPMTRAEFAAMIVNFWQVRGYEPDKRIASFSDIQQHWAKEYISAMYNTGLMNCYEDGLFHPEDPITRSETVMIINKILNRAHVYSVVPSLKDLQPSDWDYGAAEASTKYSQGTLWD